MERGEVEKNCFDYVKSIVMSNNRICYVGSMEDNNLIEKIFQTAKTNPEPSKFPDFIFDGGFVEHFEVTSSRSNRNGSKMAIEKNKLQREAEKKEKALMTEMEDTPYYEGKMVQVDKWYSTHTYNDFCLSFKKSWEKHIESLEKYAGDKSTGIFMIQYNDSALVLDNIYPDVKCGLYYGDLLKREDYKGYRITHDSNILEYIYQFKEKIKYVAFFNNDGFHGKRCEIICVENIPEILKIVKEKYRFHCAMIGSSHYIHGISVPNPFYEGNDEND